MDAQTADTRPAGPPPTLSQIKPDDTPAREWEAMDDTARAAHVSMDMRPQGVPPNRWERMSRKDRAAAVMHAKAAEWDWRGAMSGCRQADIPLAPGELERLLRIGAAGAGPAG
jgi:hypothetical protein